jgi:Protein of unknown function (DUF3313)
MNVSIQNRHFCRKTQANGDCVPAQSKKCGVAHGMRFVAHTTVFGLLASSLLLGGLSTRAQDPSKQDDQLLSHESGFLGDIYPKLQPDPKNPDLVTYWKNEDALKNSSKFILDPVIIYLLPEAQQRGIDPADLSKLAQYFTNAVKGQLTSGHYKLVTQPGPGVMVLKLAITNVQPNGGKGNAAVKGAEIAVARATVPGVSMLVPRLNVGQVAIEGEIVDSMSGDVEVAFMTSKSGSRYFSGLKAYEEWGDIDAAFRDWAKGFRERLDKAHGS